MTINTVKLNFERDINGYNAFAPDVPSYIYTATLTNGNATSITVPDDFQIWVVAFAYQPGAVVWVRKNGTAAVPAGNTLAAASSELNPTQRRAYAGDTISVITSNATTAIEVAFYAIGNNP